MFGSLDISASALVAQRQRLTTISANMALRDVAIDPNADPNDFRRRIPIFAPGDPVSGRSKGVHLKDILFDQSPFALKWDPGHSYADEQGYVKYPNIDPSMEMVNAIEASRAYEANITAAEATKVMLRASLRLLA